MKRLLFLARVFCIVLILFHPSLSRQTPPAVLAASLGRCGTGVCKPRPSAPPPPATPVIPARKLSRFDGRNPPPPPKPYPSPERYRSINELVRAQPNFPTNRKENDFVYVIIK